MHLLPIASIGLETEGMHTMHKLMYRLFFPHQFSPDDIYGPIHAYSADEALRMLADELGVPSGESWIGNLQVVRNGQWVCVK